MVEYTVRVHKKGKVTEKKVESGTNLLSFFRKNSIDVSAPCGGRGTCGKCKVRVNGLVKEPSNKEKSLLGNKSLDKGYRLACYNKIASDIDVYLDKSEDKANILTEVSEREIQFEPLIAKRFESLDVPGAEDQRSDVERLAQLFKKPKAINSLNVLRALPENLREDNFKVTLVCMEKKVIGIEAGDTTGSIYGIAIDIGTTTIAAYLYDMVTGKKVDVYSVLNPQKKYGADVISRIAYTSDNQGGLDEMNNEIIQGINDIIKHFETNNGISKGSIYSVVFVGNTTMLHFLMKVPAQNIAVSPFIPVTTSLHKFKADELGIEISPYGYALILPSVSAYVGADTVAAVMSCGMYRDDRITLLIDIGTNGEIVLGNSKWMYACSTAAGPAFEGANIRNGVGGVIGAIDSVRFSPDFGYSTIGKENAIGICGSGIVDAIAGMISEGIIDETGRIAGREESEVYRSEEMRNRLIDLDGKNSFLIEKSEQCNADTDIAITQKDVRELQNAKAAIAAGIAVLIKQAGIDIEDIENVYLAGGFGSYINIESALKIGLIPDGLRGKIKSVGNAAGAGAIEALLSSKALEKAEEIRNSIKYIELSALDEFNELYIECMQFD
ncbi:MAG: ASKHA domain-containing protein [Clostridia bacterium]|nr:ASKHA domain-containing protein [Clostridia bacterium]